MQPPGARLSQRSFAMAARAVRESNLPLTVLMDEASGRVRAILRTDLEAALEFMGGAAGSLDALFTRGIPR